MEDGTSKGHRLPRERRDLGRPRSGWRLTLYTIIFEADTAAGRLFDLGLMIVILTSVLVVMLDSVAGIAARHGTLFDRAEWLFTGLFTIEYVLRLLCVRRPLAYAMSFFGIVDLLAVCPTYLALMAPEWGALVDVRVLRLLRVFRVLKLGAYMEEYWYLAQAFSDSRRKIMVFLSAVMTAVLIGGTLMYVVEGPENGFTSIPTAVYWAITTMTTVGFGDITPKTDFGRSIAGLMMLLGWGVLAVPTGIVTAEMTSRARLGRTSRCGSCGSAGHERTARYCRDCGAPLGRAEEQNA